MPNRDLDREILELGFTGQPTPIIPQDVALDYMLGLRKLANALAPPPEKPPAQTPTMSASGPIPVPEVGTETPEAVIDRDQALTLAQTQAELEATSAKAKELQEQLMEAERVTNQAQVTAEMSQAQAGEAMEAATSATANAAAQADAKMRLSMRINEMRQQLSDIVSSDPVTEEGIGTGEVAGPGTPQTAAQQGQEALVAEQEQAAAAEAAGAGGDKKPVPAKAAKEVDQAQRAQVNAVQQTAQAEQATSGKTASKDSDMSPRDAANAKLDKWVDSYDKSKTKKRVGGPAAVGGITAGGVAAALARRSGGSGKAALAKGALGALAGTATGAAAGGAKMTRDRYKSVKGVAPLVAQTPRIYGARPVGAQGRLSDGKITVFSTRGGKNYTQTFDPRRTTKKASDESGGSDRVRTYLARNSEADARLKRLTEAAYFTGTPVQPTGPGGFAEKAENVVNGDLVQDVKVAYKTKDGKVVKHPVSEKQRRWAFAAESQGKLPKGTALKWSKRVEGKDLPTKKKKKNTGTEKIAEGGKECATARIRKVLQESPKAKRAKDFFKLVSKNRYDVGHYSD